MAKRGKIKLNSISALEYVLQDCMDELFRMTKEVQDNINKLQNSTSLVDVSIAEKVAYSKAMNDFISSKKDIIKLKSEVAKIMNDIYKTKLSHNKNTANGNADNDMGDTTDDVITKGGINDVDELRAKLEKLQNGLK